MKIHPLIDLVIQHHNLGWPLVSSRVLQFPALCKDSAWSQSHQHHTETTPLNRAGCDQATLNINSAVSALASGINTPTPNNITGTDILHRVLLPLGMYPLWRKISDPGLALSELHTRKNWFRSGEVWPHQFSAASKLLQAVSQCPTSTASVGAFRLQNAGRDFAYSCPSRQVPCLF